MEGLSTSHQKALVSFPFTGNNQILHWPFMHIDADRKGDFFFFFLKFYRTHFKNTRSDFGNVGLFWWFRLKNIFWLSENRKAGEAA